MVESLVAQITEDGSTTFWNPLYQESYHSSIGAYTEALHKHVIATKIPELAANSIRINILDLCFGLGYNSLVAIAEAQKINPSILINIIALENDRNIINKITELQLPEELNYLQSEFTKLSYVNEIANKNFNVKLVLGDARETVRNLTANFFDAIFFDPFSPKVCPELWQADFINDVIRTLKTGSYISTYSSARIAKDNFAAAGCQILEGPKLNRRNGGVLGVRQ